MIWGSVAERLGADDSLWREGCLEILVWKLVEADSLATIQYRRARGSDWAFTRCNAEQQPLKSGFPDITFRFQIR